MIYIIYSLYIYEQIVHIVILKLLYVIIVPKCLSYKRLKIVCIYIYTFNEFSCSAEICKPGGFAAIYMPTTSSVSEGSSITAAPWHQLLDLRNCRIQRFPKSSKSQKNGDFTILEFFDFLDLLVANFLAKDVSICGFLEANLTPLETSEYLNFNRDLENRKNGGEWWELVKWEWWLFIY